jgi:hypothetical protein
MARESTLRSLRLLATLATIASLIVVAGVLYSIFKADTNAVLAVKADWIDLPVGFNVEDTHKFDDLTDQISRLLNFEDLKRIMSDFRFDRSASLVKLTIENRGAVSSKNVRAYFGDFIAGVELLKHGSKETKQALSKDNVEVGILEPGDTVILYGLTGTTYYGAPPTRVLQADKIVPVIFERYVGAVDPLGIISWAINHPTVTTILVAELELIVGVMFLCAIPIAVLYLWRSHRPD